MASPVIASALPRAGLRFRGQDFLILLFYAGVFTVSFDLFLVFNLGFNFRFAQLAWGLPMVAMLAQGAYRKRIRLPMEFLSLWLWFVCMVVFLPNAILLSRGVGYAFWLFYNVVFIVATCNLFNTYEKLLGLMRVYLLSFVAVSAYGAYQFIAPSLHLPAFLVQSWWFEDVLPRVNGFSYEPSYYASYLLMGWVLAAYFLKVKTNLFGRQFLQVVFYSTSFALVLSSSRMGWIFMAIWYLQYPLGLFRRLLKGRIHLPYLKISLVLLAIAILGGVGVLFVVGVERVMFLLEGLGIGGSSTVSAGPRIRQLKDTFQIFLDSPFFGYSLGGIASAIGGLRGIQVDSIELARSNQGMAIFAEVLAASGIVGFIPFAFYMLGIIVRPLKRAARLPHQPMADMLRALVIALLFELAILQLNQNILRLYLWLHIAILSAAFSVALGFLTSARTSPPASSES